MQARHSLNVVFVFWATIFLFVSHQETVFSNQVHVGDSRDRVVETLGEPEGTTEFANIEVLYYPRGKIEIESGHVVSHNLISPEELETQTEKRLMEEEARRQREALQLEAQETEEETVLQETVTGYTESPKESLVRDLYNIGTSSKPSKRVSSDATPMSGPLDYRWFPKRLTWKQSKHTRGVPYLIVKQGKDPKEIALYRKHPRSSTNESFLFYVRRQDTDKTLTLHTQSSGDDPKFWLEFKGDGEVWIYFTSGGGSKKSEWTYVARRYGDEKKSRLHVFRMNNREPSLIIEADHSAGTVAIFRTEPNSWTPQTIPLRVYDPSRYNNAHADSIQAPFGEDVIGIFAAVDILRPK